jgi:hypothetical protein
MTLIVSGASAQGRTEGLLIDVALSPNEYNDCATGEAQIVAVQRGYAILPLGMGTASLITHVGAAVSQQTDATTQMQVWRFVSAAAFQASRINGSGPGSGNAFLCTLGKYGNAALFNRPLRRYRYDIPSRAPVRGAAVLEIALAQSTALFLIGGGVLPAAAWVSDPAINAGAWTPRYRRVNAGPITDGPTSGILPNVATFDTLGFRYTEGAIPTLEWMIGDTPHFSLSGGVAVGINHTGSHFGFGYGVGAVVGTTFEVLGTRVRVEEI